MSKKRDGITVAGSLIADVYYEIDTYPQLGFLTNVRNSSFHIGGSGNLILDLAKLDSTLSVGVCAIVGTDENGKQLLSTLKKYPNISTENLSIEGETSVTIVMNAEDTKQRTFFYIAGASDVFDESYISWEDINSKIFHLEYLLLMKRVDSPDAEYGTHGARILKKAKDHGMITSIDMVSEQSDRVPSVIIPALKYTDICCINEAEASAVTGIDLVENGVLSKDRCIDAIQELHRLGVSKWIVIHAPRESYGYDCEKDFLVNIKSHDLPADFIKGSTGAGDAYCSGILYGAYRDFSLEEAMSLARSCAACSLSESNGTDGMRTFTEIQTMFS